MKRLIRWRRHPWLAILLFAAQPAGAQTPSVDFDGGVDLRPITASLRASSMKTRLEIHFSPYDHSFNNDARDYCELISKGKTPGLRLDGTLHVVAGRVLDLRFARLRLQAAPDGKKADLFGSLLTGTNEVRLGSVDLSTVQNMDEDYFVQSSEDDAPVVELAGRSDLQIAPASVRSPIVIGDRSTCFSRLCNVILRSPLKDAVTTTLYQYNVTFPSGAAFCLAKDDKGLAPTSVAVGRCL